MTSAALTSAGPTGRIPRPSQLWTIYAERVLAPAYAAHPLMWALALALLVFALPLLFWPLALAVAGLGAFLYRERSRYGPAGRMTGNVTAGVATVGLDVMAVLWLFGDHKSLAALAGLATVELLLREPQARNTDRASWYGHDRLVAALVKAGVLSWPKPDEEPLRLRYLGTPTVETDDEGVLSETVEVVLPGVKAAAVTAKRVECAAAIGAVDRLFLVELNPDHEAGAVTITRGYPRTPRIDPVVVPDRMTYGTPMSLLDDRGRTVEVPVAALHLMAAGSTGSGKTVFGRFDALPAILDPTVQIAALVGKDDLDDWTALAPLCDLGYVGGLSRGELGKVEGVLTRLTELNESRAKLSRTDPPPYVHVIVEEAYAILGALKRLDPDTAARCSLMYDELLRTARSRRILVRSFTQRATDLPTDHRSNIALRLIGYVVEEAEARYALGYKPDAVPQAPDAAKGRPARFLLSMRDARAKLVTIPYLDDDGFRTACARGLELRRHPASAVSLVKAARPVEDELALAVRVVLEDTGPATATTILGQLPERLAPPTARDLGVALGRYAAAGLLARTPVGKSAGWALTPAAPRQMPAGPPQVTPAADSGPPQTPTMTPADRPALPRPTPGDTPAPGRRRSTGPRPHLAAALARVPVDAP